MSVPDQTVFAQILPLVTKHQANIEAAYHELSETMHYPLASAAFAIMLALIRLDDAHALARILLAKEIDGVNVLAFLDEPSVQETINAWTNPAIAVAASTNSTTALVRFALSYDAHSALVVLLSNTFIAERLTLYFYRQVLSQIAHTLEAITNAQDTKDLLVYIGKEKMAVLQGGLDDGGVAVLRDALDIIVHYKLRSLVVRNQPLPNGQMVTPEKKAVIESEIRRDLARERQLALNRLLQESDDFLKLVCSESLELLLTDAAAKRRAILATVPALAAIDEDADVDDKVEGAARAALAAQVPPGVDEALNEALAPVRAFQEDLRQYEKMRREQTAESLPPVPTIEMQLQTNGNVIGVVRQLIAGTTCVAHHHGAQLEQLENECDTEKLAKREEEIVEFRDALATIDADNYLM